MNGAVGTALDSPISASGPRRRRNGKPCVPDGVVAAHIGAPMRLRLPRGAAHIGVVIAGHQVTSCGGPERFEPGARRRIFGRQRDIDEVAGHRDVVGRLRLEVGDDARQHVARGGSGCACAAS